MYYWIGVGIGVLIGWSSAIAWVLLQEIKKARAAIDGREGVERGS